jgi:cell division protein FtsQ
VNAGNTIRKFFMVTLWIVIGGGMLSLLIAAIGKNSKERCSDYRVTIKGARHNFFVDKTDIQEMLAAASGGQVKGKLLSAFNLFHLEQLLEKNVWIRDAELYFDNRNVLHVTIIEREPIARVFTTNGKSFYIDNSARAMPLSDKLSARVPVFTGFPDKKIVLRKDSVLVNNVIQIAQFIQNDSFWMSQVAQIDITPARDFEMIPVVGDHLVKLGNGDDAENKFRRLFIFYKEVLSKTGFDKYKVLDIQFRGQVIAKKGLANGKVDSIQLRKNVEKLLRQSKEIQVDTVVVAEPKHIEKPTIKIDKTTAPLKLADQPDTKSNADPNAVKTTSNPSSGSDKRVPKAVMPKKEGQNRK